MVAYLSDELYQCVKWIVSHLVFKWVVDVELPIMIFTKYFIIKKYRSYVMPLLFTKDLFDLTRGLFESVHKQISLISLGDLSKVNDIATDIYNCHVLQPITLLEDKKTTDSEIRNCQLYDYMRDQHYFRNCEVYTFSIPFEGTRQLFDYHASQFRMEYTEAAEVNPKCIKIEVVDKDNSPERVIGEFNKTLDSIKWNLDKINPEISQYDSQLRRIVTSGIENRIKQIRDKRQKEIELGFPPRGSDHAIQDIPIVIKPNLVIDLEPIQNDSSKQFRISDFVFDKIVECVMFSATSMERAPESYSSLDEEQIRDHLLSAINGMLATRGSGETFNNKGHTDILFSYQNHNVFIAECKIWKGVAYVGNGLEQLEGYLSWGDTKTSLIVFYKNKSEMTNSIQQLDEFIRSRPNFSRVIEDNKRGFRYSMAHPKDSAKHYVLETIFFNLSV